MNVISDKLLGYDEEFNIENDISLKFSYADKSKYVKVTFEDGSFCTYTSIDWYDHDENRRIKKEIMNHNKEIRYKLRQEKINKILNV